MTDIAAPPADAIERMLARRKLCEAVGKAAFDIAHIAPPPDIDLVNVGRQIMDEVDDLRAFYHHRSEEPRFEP